MYSHFWCAGFLPATRKSKQRARQRKDLWCGDLALLGVDAAVLVNPYARRRLWLRARARGRQDEGRTRRSNTPRPSTEVGYPLRWSFA